MKQTFVKWVQGRQFLVIGSSKHSIVISSQDADNAVGMRPNELMLLALSSCTAVDVVDILAKKRTPIDFMEIVATSEQDNDPPWAFRKIHLMFRVGGKGLT